jgi:DNA topoisomerase-1
MDNYISRKKIKNKYLFFDENNKIITDKKLLERISKIYIAPAYTHVKIYLDQNILATGIDSAGRTQYIYSEDSKKKREEKKSKTLLKICNNLEKLEKKIDRDLNRSFYSKNKLIAVILTIMNLCNFRSGNKKYEKNYGSYGITTLHKKHVTFDKKVIKIEFIGKKGVLNSCIIEDSKIANMLKQIYKMNNKFNPYFFSIINEKKEEINISNNDLNNYLAIFNITSKDLRTWNANIIFLNNLKENFKLRLKKDSIDYNTLVDDKKIKYKKKIIRETINQTAELLHHTPAICKSSYINKMILSKLIENDDLIYKLLRNQNNIEHFLKSCIKY